MCLSIAVDRPKDVLASGNHSGHEWMVVHNGMGYRCGYVKVCPGHPWHGKDYGDIEADVHGGLTFAEADKPCGKGGEDDGYWIGFDCWHSGDAKDLALLSEDARNESFDREFYQSHPQYADLKDYYVVRDQEYVEAECRSLCDQAAAMSKS